MSLLPLKLLELGIPFPDSLDEYRRQWFIYWCYQHDLVVGDIDYWLGAHYTYEEADMFSEAVINELQEIMGS